MTYRSAFWSAVNQQEYPPIPRFDFYWNDHFPIKTVTALRISILEPRVVNCLFRAIWVDNLDVSDEKILLKLLNDNGFNGRKLLNDITKGESAASVKAILKKNNEEAEALGICGVPTFEIEGNPHLIWGQDRLATVQVGAITYFLVK